MAVIPEVLASFTGKMGELNDGCYIQALVQALGRARCSYFADSKLPLARVNYLYNIAWTNNFTIWGVSIAFKQYTRLQLLNPISYYLSSYILLPLMVAWSNSYEGSFLAARESQAFFGSFCNTQRYCPPMIYKNLSCSTSCWNKQHQESICTQAFLVWEQVSLVRTE